MKRDQSMGIIAWPVYRICDTSLDGSSIALSVAPNIHIEYVYDNFKLSTAYSTAKQFQHCLKISDTP